VILATFPVIEEIPPSLEFFNVLFFAVLVSTLIQGSRVEAAANRLGCTRAHLPRPGPSPDEGRSRVREAEKP
jgi:potassium/hydrogen antiporter